MEIQTRLNPIHRNESFVCKHCKEANPPNSPGCRNHCRNCLYSLHVDEKTPGDRTSKCLGFMEPIDIEQSQKKGFQILHRCKECGKMMRNKIADDDDLYLVTQLIKRHNENTQSKAAPRAGRHTLANKKEKIGRRSAWKTTGSKKDRKKHQKRWGHDR